MPEFIIFSYKLAEQVYVEAYPTHGLPASKLLSGFPMDLSFRWVLAPSRNQARKLAYRHWVRADGVGFNKLPYRAR